MKIGGRAQVRAPTSKAKPWRREGGARPIGDGYVATLARLLAKLGAMRFSSLAVGDSAAAVIRPLAS